MNQSLCDVLSQHRTIFKGHGETTVCGCCDWSSFMLFVDNRIQQWCIRINTPFDPVVPYDRKIISSYGVMGLRWFPYKGLFYSDFHRLVTCYSVDPSLVYRYTSNVVVIVIALFVTCGQRHISFWHRDSLDTNPNVTFCAFPGVLGKKARMQTLTSVTALGV